MQISGISAVSFGLRASSSKFGPNDDSIQTAITTAAGRMVDEEHLPKSLKQPLALRWMQGYYCAQSAATRGNMRKHLNSAGENQPITSTWVSIEETVPPRIVLGVEHNNNGGLHPCTAELIPNA